MKKPTHLTTYCGLHGSRVAAKTGITLDEISELIFMGGTIYSYGYPGFEKELQYSKVFWDWFKLQWYKQDAKFLGMFSDKNNPIDPALYYASNRANLEAKVFIPSKRLAKIIREATPPEKAVKIEMGCMDSAALPLEPERQFKHPLIKI